MSSSASSALTGRQSHARTNSHSHSLLAGALNPTHRITRRKSVTTPAANVAALTAAIRESEQSGAIPIASGGRRNTTSKQVSVRAGLFDSLPSPPASLPNKSMLDAKREMQDSAIDDDSNELSADEAAAKFDQARIRRASDGQPLTKDGKKSNRVEVRCETCGKGYKHSSCLTKHLWEHTPEWSFTSKLLISKHQQVQLLEAASVLVAMNGNPKERSVTPPDSARDFASEPETASPTASGYSEQADGQSSADTTPPPIAEDGLGFDTSAYREKRYSIGSVFSRSFQSPQPSNPLILGSIPNPHGFDHVRSGSIDLRPSSSGANASGQDDHDLAAAVELLSCSFGSNNGTRSAAATLVEDAPPVPPVPAQFLDQAASFASAGFINSYPSRQPESFTRGEMRRGSEDVKMEDSEDDFDMRSRARSDEDDDGVFGRMEE
ncbi:c2h2 finger domain-containing [Trichoderma arundinaceum]|uniref:C2h2 finger domain-containing n=1 Tax=Trichoderma arundinaceum TaxID=490622 RepID=A0A395NMW0_TRIAR|nr:c2h2 finger domain-containing [Trichoderma arundinaceum]